MIPLTLIFAILSSISAVDGQAHSLGKGARQGLNRQLEAFISKEVCVLGGGAAGAYTAYELQKRGYEVVLIEPQDHLGGNCVILDVASTLDSFVTYKVNAAVILFSPDKAVKDFFNEFNAPTDTFNRDQTNFVYDADYAVSSAPVQDPQVLVAALQEFFIITNSQPYTGINVIPPLPDWDVLTSKQQETLLEPFGIFLARNPSVIPLRPLISALMQGFGYVDNCPMWEILAYGGPTYINQIFTDAFLTLPDGCQDLYDDLEGSMMAADPDSVKTNTGVKKIIRGKQDGPVKIFTEGLDETLKYSCDDAIVAFRPNGLDETTLADITAEEKAFFGDLGYNGYIPSVWSMDIGLDLSDAGVNPDESIMFSSAEAVDVGIMNLIKKEAPCDYPWNLFYQPDEPADTQEKLDVIRSTIIAHLTALGFVNIQELFLSNAKYAIKPQSVAQTLAWTSFFRTANNDEDHLFWTGSVTAGEGSENVWQYSLELMNAHFPYKR